MRTTNTNVIQFNILLPFSTKSKFLYRISVHKEAKSKKCYQEIRPPQLQNMKRELL